jgi:hypothetical protein
MAQLGPAAPKAADVAEVMGRTSMNLGPTRAELINMGLLYTPQHGYAAFTVPHFDRYIMRAVPILEVPPLRRRGSWVSRGAPGSRSVPWTPLSHLPPMERDWRGLRRS